LLKTKAFDGSILAPRPSMSRMTWNYFGDNIGEGGCGIPDIIDQNGNNEPDLPGKYEIRDLWEHKTIGKGQKWNRQIKKHEITVFRLKEIAIR